MKKYTLKFRGLPLPAGHIRAKDVVVAINSLMQTARGTTLLIATGTSRARNSKYPAWIVSATDLVFSGVGSGSTTLEVSAPCLLDSANDHFRFKDLWAPDVEVRKDDTALDLVMDAIDEAKDDGSRGDRYDYDTLKSISKLRRIGGSSGTAFTLSSTTSGGRSVSLEPKEFEKFTQRRASIPAPSEQVVSGILDQLQYSDSCFQINIGQGKKVSGKLANDELDREILRPLWGSKTTVVGRVFYTANGDVRLIEAHEIRPFKIGDELFQKVPKPLAQPSYRKNVLSKLREGAEFDPRSLVNKWPGDEPIELLLEQLREL